MQRPTDTMTILDKIVAHKITEVAAAKARTTVAQLEQSEFYSRNTHSLKQFLLDPARTGIIAEFKRKSPSKGVINDWSGVEEVTTGYNAAGASALSVLTDQNFFMGANEDLIKARQVNEIPILRKDFIIDEYQIIEAKAIGADVVLLIASILTPSQITKFAAVAKSLGLSVLLEVHNLEELKPNLDPNVDAIGVNNRNLADFSVSVETSFTLSEYIPDEYVKVSESAISNIQVIKQLKADGYKGFLIGEKFMKDKDPGACMADFVKGL